MPHLPEGLPGRHVVIVMGELPQARPAGLAPGASTAGATNPGDTTPSSTTPGARSPPRAPDQGGRRPGAPRPAARRPPMWSLVALVLACGLRGTTCADNLGMCSGLRCIPILSV